MHHIHLNLFAIILPVACVGVYGDVQRVKILYNKKDSALIQMAEPHQAHLGELSQHIILPKKSPLNLLQDLHPSPSLGQNHSRSCPGKLHQLLCILSTDLLFFSLVC